MGILQRTFKHEFKGLNRVALKVGSNQEVLITFPPPPTATAAKVIDRFDEGEDGEGDFQAVGRSKDFLHTLMALTNGLGKLCSQDFTRQSTETWIPKQEESGVMLSGMWNMVLDPQ